MSDPGSGPTPIRIEVTHPEDPVVADLVADYVAHLVNAVPGGYDPATDSPPPAGAFEPPRGSFLVMYDADRPVGCGAVWLMEPTVAEIRRMWISPTHHGRGLGRRMLGQLEAEAVRLGAHTARLDSMGALTAAVSMYRSQGYSEISDYNSNPNATVWMERALR